MKFGYIVFSVLLIVLGFIIKPDCTWEYFNITSNDIRFILPAIGTSLLATILYSHFSDKKFTKEKESYDSLCKDWGIASIYEDRNKMNKPCKDLFQHAESIDIAAIRLRTLITEHKSALEKLVKEKKVNIRILLPIPRKEILSHLAEFLGDKIDSIIDNMNLIRDWVDKINHDPHVGDIEIRYVSSVFTFMYQRIDNHFFFGPYSNKNIAPDVFTLEGSASGVLGNKLSIYFNRSFEQASLIPDSRQYIIEFLGMPGSGKSTCAIELMKNRALRVKYHTNEGVPISENDSPYDFNKRLIDQLKEFSDFAGKGNVLLFDRGTVDMKIWLKVHHDRNNINDDQYKKLLQKIPKFNKNISHYKFLFLQTPNTTLTRREKYRGKHDSWALEETILNKLHAEYTKIANSQNDHVYLVNSERNISDLMKDVFSHIDGIIKLEEARVRMNGDK